MNTLIDLEQTIPMTREELLARIDELEKENKYLLERLKHSEYERFYGKSKVILR